MYIFTLSLLSISSLLLSVYIYWGTIHIYIYIYMCSLHHRSFTTASSRVNTPLSAPWMLGWDPDEPTLRPSLNDHVPTPGRLEFLDLVRWWDPLGNEKTWDPPRKRKIIDSKMRYVPRKVSFKGTFGLIPKLSKFISAFKIKK